MRARFRDLAFVLAIGTICCGCRKEPRGADPKSSDATKETARTAEGAPPPRTVDARNERAEPKLSFVVRVGGTDVQLTEGEEALAKGAFTDPTVSVTVHPERVFTHAGLSFSYPRQFTFEADLEEKASESWTLSGNDVKIMIFRMEVQLAVESFAKEIATGLGPDSSITPASIKLGTTEYSGQRIRARMASHEFTQEIFPLPATASGGSRFIVIQDDAEGDAPESVPTREMLKKTFRITK